MVSGLEGLRCASCETVYLPPRSQCPACGQTESKSAPLSGGGTVRAWTTIHIAPTRYEREAPYTVVLVDLDDGPPIMGRLAAGPAVESGARVVFTEMDAQRGPLFRRA